MGTLFRVVSGGCMTKECLYLWCLSVGPNWGHDANHCWLSPRKWLSFFTSKTGAEAICLVWLFSGGGGLMTLCAQSTLSKWCLPFFLLCCYIPDIRSQCYVLFSSTGDVEMFWVSDIEGTKIKVPFLVCAGIFNRAEISMKNKAAFEVKKKDVKVHPSWESSVGGFQGTSVPCHNTWICLQWPELLSIAGFMPLPW